jgi:hypothetical protein
MFEIKVLAQELPLFGAMPFQDDRLPNISWLGLQK